MGVRRVTVRPFERSARSFFAASISDGLLKQSIAVAAKVLAAIGRDLRPSEPELTANCQLWGGNTYGEIAMAKRSVIPSCRPSVPFCRSAMK